jgi:hypothetical protein
MSDVDMDKGARWELEVGSMLEQSDFGVICLTPENLDSQWINFEAGALSKAVEKARVWTYLFDLRPTDVRGPLSRFSHTIADKEDTRRLVDSIYFALQDPTLDRTIVSEAFELHWWRLEEILNTMPPTDRRLAPPRKVDDMIEEILELVRVQVREGSFAWQSELPRPRLPSTLDWPPEDAQLMLEYYQLLVREHTLNRDEQIRSKYQAAITRLKFDTEYAARCLSAFKALGHWSFKFDSQDLVLIEVELKQIDENTGS